MLTKKRWRVFKRGVNAVCARVCACVYVLGLTYGGLRGRVVVVVEMSAVPLCIGSMLHHGCGW